MAPLRRVLLRVLSFFRSGRAEADLAREIRAHLHLLEDRFIAQGMSADDARCAARRAFGGVEQVKEHQRDARSFRWLDGWWLDLKLGGRLLIKYPGLTLVGGLAISFAIATGAATFEFMTQLVYPTLPLDEGDRVVGIQLWHTKSSSVEEQALYDFATWREEIESVEDLGVFRTLERNLITADGLGEPVSVAEISASAFRLARVRPLLGRTLIEADEQAGAPAVVVIGYDLWSTRFGGAPDVVGRNVRLGSVQSTVVGVMPEGFAFPISHSVWVPLRLSVLSHGRRQGPEVQVFGRLAPGVTFGQAQAELTSIGLRAAADFPDTHEHLRPQVMPYAQSISMVSGLSTWESVGLVSMSINLLLLMLLVLVCGNVALLMFARAATRETEILVRNALGASRGRIVMQLFAEALVLGGVAAAVGLSAAGAGLRWGLDQVAAEVGWMRGGRLPFWFSDNLSVTTLIYAAVLTVFGAVIAGVVPALKVTRGLESRLRQATAGGLGFGGLWTAVIITQVAVTVAFPAVAFFVRRDAVQIRSVDVGFPAEQYLSVRLEMDPETASGVPASPSRGAFLARFHAACQELERRLAADPAVAGVTIADRLPRMYHPRRFIEVEGGAAPRDPRYPGYGVGSASIDVDYFDVLGTPILSGRGFHSGDLESDQGVMIVNTSFVELVLGGRNAIGRRVRTLDVNESGEARSKDPEPGPWYEIVGVVRDMGMAVSPDPKVAGFYEPLVTGATYPVHMAVHVRGEPEAFAPRLRAVATTIDPTLRIDSVQRLDEVNTAELQFIAFWFRLTALVSSVAMLLSLAGIYSVMSFTVSRRTREIGIRVALGAKRGRVVAGILRRPLAQVALGIAAGAGLVAALTLPIYEGALSATQVALIAAYAALMMGVCMLACIVPTRRALRIEPTEALRSE